MKDEKKVTKAEEVKEKAKETVQPEEKGTKLTDEELSSVAAGFEATEFGIKTGKVEAYR